jgi:acyl-CoA reductase-like NAD-dependent aldehyde dehydrogenase
MTKTLFFDGTWQAASTTMPVVDPATGQAFAEISVAGREETQRAIASAAEGFRTWSALNPYTRAKHLRQAAELIRKNAKAFAADTTREAGKPLPEAQGEWLVAADFFDWFAEEAKRTYGYVIPSRKDGKRMQVIYQPMGVVAAIAAWNFPAYNTARVWSAMLAAGCAVIMKPSEATPFTAIRMLECLLEAGVPDRAVNLLMGDADAIGQALLDDPVVRKVHLVGSTRVGKLLMEGSARTTTKLSLELGGNAPALVFDDADIELVARSAVQAKFRNAGQVCISPQRILVQRGGYRRFVAAAEAEIGKLVVGAGTEPGVSVGPMISERQRARCVDLIARTVSGGTGRLVTGGTIPADRPAGFFLSPALIADCAANAPVFEEEIFGPVMCVAPFEDLAEALRLGNATRYGLAAYVWTNDLNLAVKAAEGLEFGMVGVNEWYPHATEAPFGGWKQSGIGQEGGREGILEYLEKKLISVTVV